MARRTHSTAPASSLEATQVLDPHAMEHTQILDPNAMEHTQVLDVHAMDRTSLLDPQAMEATRTSEGGTLGTTRIQLDVPLLEPVPDLAPAPRRIPWKVVGVAAAGLVLGLGAWGLIGQSAPSGVAAQAGAKASIPSDLESLLVRAQAGDAVAMRTVATRYTYGLGVPVDREEGIRWYRKAVESGSRVAQEELKALEGR